MQSKFQLPSIPGLLLIVLFAAVATALSTLPFFQHLSLSPLVVGILIGIVFANTLGRYLPEEWRSGLKFCSKRILRIGIIFFGFRLTLADVAQVGLSAVALDIFIVCSTIGLGLLVGKWLNMDKETTLLTSSGSAICGAAAVLGAEATLKSEAYKTAVAVSTVVLFGTLSMFLYPVLYRAGVFDLPAQQMGIFAGSTIHEVAHVVGAGNAMGAAISDNAIIVKMIRVMMLVPVLLVIAFFVAKDVAKREGTEGQKNKIQVPWFAIMFLLVICFNSFNLLPEEVVKGIVTLDTFLLTMAMTALGAETSIDKFKKAGFKPFLLAAIIYCWLIGGGYCLARFVVPMLM